MGIREFFKSERGEATSSPECHCCNGRGAIEGVIRKADGAQVLIDRPCPICNPHGLFPIRKAHNKSVGIIGYLALRKSDGDDDADDHPSGSCPICGGPGVHLGNLGARTHFRCRNCGMDFSRRGNETAKDKDVSKKSLAFDQPLFDDSTDDVLFAKAAGVMNLLQRKVIKPLKAQAMLNRLGVQKCSDCGGYGTTGGGGSRATAGEHACGTCNGSGWEHTRTAKSAGGIREFFKSKRKGKKSMRPGGGGRFAKLKKKLGKKGIRNPGALAGKIGRKKFGKKKMAKWSSQGRKRAGRK